MSQKVLIARVDRIGDLILTLPMQIALEAQEPDVTVRWLTEKNLKFVTDAANLNAHFISRHGTVLQYLNLVRWLKKEKFDRVYSVHVPWWVALAFWWTKIPSRIGVASQWYSWIFYNKAIRQNRSQGLKNEAQYNLELLENPSPKLQPGKFKIDGQKNIQWSAILGSGFVVIHPGMAGSAKNWPAKKYAELAQKLIQRGNRVVVTGTSSDRTFIEESGILQVSGVEDFVEKTPGEDLLAVLNLAKAVVVPSTGVAHLAATLGKKTIGLYSPVRVQAPKRWGPIGEKVHVFQPEVDCPGQLKCVGPRCSFYDCMDKIEVDSVVETVMEKD